MVILVTASLPTSQAAEEPLYVTIYVNRAVEEERIVVTLFGNITRANRSPVILATVSIEVNDPHGSSVHIALLHSDNKGSYSDTFELGPEQTTGNYTIYVTASKLGFRDAQAILIFSIGIAPFSISVSPASLTITQGETAVFEITLQSEGQISSVVHIEVTGLPVASSYSLSSNNETAPATVTLRIETSTKVNSGSYTLTVIGRSNGGESRATAEILVEEANMIGYYASIVLPVVMALALLVLGILFYRKVKARKQPKPLTDIPEYVQGFVLSPTTLISLPDHLRKTAIILCNLKEASANEIAARSGRARAAESDYLNQLVRMGIVKKRRKGRESYFFVE